MFLAIALLALAGFIFLRTPPAQLAILLRSAFPLVLIAIGLVLIVLGRVGVGSFLLIGGVTLLRRMRGVLPMGGGMSGGPRRSSVRSAALEMELDHDSGAMNGIVLAGQFEGRELDDMAEDELLELRMEIAKDSDSANLLDSYLDGRFPAWREDAEGDRGAGQAGPPRTGAMGEEEAYEVLGLSPGANAREIRAAHRRLMKTAHPDSGGSTFLAAKINEAKDVLLKSHS